VVESALLVLAPIPGWFALGHYRKWKRAQIPRPNGLIAWGLGFSAFFVVMMIIGALNPSP
jgi:hypothetical protein